MGLLDPARCLRPPHSAVTNTSCRRIIPAVGFPMRDHATPRWLGLQRMARLSPSPAIRDRPSTHSLVTPLGVRVCANPPRPVSVRETDWKSLGRCRPCVDVPCRSASALDHTLEVSSLASPLHPKVARAAEPALPEMPCPLLFREQDHASRNAFRRVMSPASQARGRAPNIPCAGSVWGSAPSSRELCATGPHQRFQRAHSSLGCLHHRAPFEARRQAAGGTLDQRLQPTCFFKDEHPRLVLLPTCAEACASSLASGPPVYTVGVPLW
jgi:hypothetical protein